MQYLNNITNQDSPLFISATGRYYTHQDISAFICRNIATLIAGTQSHVTCLSIIDPFCGDGRLVFDLVEALEVSGTSIGKYSLHLWDVSDFGFEELGHRLDSMGKIRDKISLDLKSCDAFREGLLYREGFDVVITNPPWEIVKPDSRELQHLSPAKRDVYIKNLSQYSEYLSSEFSISNPRKKFGGWGVNLSRVGLELSCRLVKKNGYLGIVLPSSFLSDLQSSRLRSYFFHNFTVSFGSYYPAEAKLFGKADTTSSTIIATKCNSDPYCFAMSIFNSDLSLKYIININSSILAGTDSDTPFSLTMTQDQSKSITSLRKFGKEWATLEGTSGILWAGRELDETRFSEIVTQDSEHGIPFIKGRDISRFLNVTKSAIYLDRLKIKKFNSMNYWRIAWRDVSRQSQKRRITATLIPSGFITGNSLGIAFRKDNDLDELKLLLSIMNSLCFEFQLRQKLVTGHISLSAIRTVYIPQTLTSQYRNQLLESVDKILQGQHEHEFLLDAMVAKYLYRISKDEYESVVNSYEKLSSDDTISFISSYQSLPGEVN